MQVNLVTIREWAPFSAYVCGAIAALVAFLFALHKFKIGREAEQILKIELSVDRMPASNLVDVSIQVKNVGKTAAYVSQNNVKRALLMVRKISSSENHAQLIWQKLENQQLISNIEYITFYGKDPIRHPVTNESPTTTGWQKWWRAFVHPIRRFFTFVEYGIPIYLYSFLYSIIWYAEPFGNEYPMIYEPATITTHHVFFSTDYCGPLWIRAELISEKEYRWRPPTQYSWGCDLLFALPRS
jgi:hypothetical protein